MPEAKAKEQRRERIGKGIYLACGISVVVAFLIMASRPEPYRPPPPRELVSQIVVLPDGSEVVCVTDLLDPTAGIDCDFENPVKEAS